jgi:ATP-dependent Clp protease, protease subunit
MKEFIMKKCDHEHQSLKQPLIMGYADSYVKLSKSRSIFLAEDITKQAGAELSALLLYYDNLSHEEPIHLYIHTDGGDVSGLSNIYDAMQIVKAPIKTLLLGKCYSAGAVILAAGTKGERRALKSSKVMIHGIQFGFPIPGTDTASNKNYYEFVKNNNDNLMKILAKHTGQPLTKIKEDCVRELWMDSKASLEYGVIDHIV